MTKTRSQILQRSQVLGPQLRGQFEKFPPLHELFLGLLKFKLIFWAIAGFILADFAMLGLGAYLAPSEPPGRQERGRIVEIPSRLEAKSAYSATLSKNMFCPGCPIPELKIQKVEKPKDCNIAKPQSGSLKLLGTIVLSDPQHSVATISGVGGNNIAVQTGDRVGNFGTVFEIRQRRVCITTASDELTYIELPEEIIKFGQPVAPPPSMSRNEPRPTKVEGIDAVSETEFHISRNTLIQKLQDPNLLFQAHAVPNRGPDGRINGFKVLSIQPGSVYEALGVKVGDVVNQVNGEPLTSIGQVQSTYNNIRTASDMTISVLRNGQAVDMNYSIK